MKQTAADRKARRLAQKILGQDFKKLFKKGYLVFKIKLKGTKTKLKKLLICKNITVYGYDKRSNSYYRYCSLIRNTMPWQYEQNVYEQGYGAQAYSKFDKLVAYYLWLKEYSKSAVSIQQFKEQFNHIDDEYTWHRLKKDMKSRYF